MSKILFTDREAWLTEAACLMLNDLIMPTVGAIFPTPDFRISVGFPKHSRGGKVVAVCFKKEASTDGVNEVFINPEIDDVLEILHTTAHELIHAVDNCESGHKGFFARIARKIGLVGKLTATTAGPELEKKLMEYADLLGEFPHNRMEMNKVHKKDGTRQLKVSCSDGNCGFIFRTSAVQLMKMGKNAPCPCCGNALVIG